MSELPEIDRLVSALAAAQTVVASADRVSISEALSELEGAWAKCPAGSLDSFDCANIQLSRTTLMQLLDLDAGEAIGDALRLIRDLGAGEEDQRLTVQVLLEAGNHARQTGDFETAKPLIDEAIERAHTALGPLDEEAAQAHNCLGIWGRYRGEFELARRSYEAALRILELDHPPEAQANILHNLASLEHLDGNPESALKLIESALSLRKNAAERDADDAVRAAILIDLGRYPDSDRLFRSLSTRLSQRWGSDSAEVMHLNANWAVLEQHQGNLDAAQKRYAQAIVAAERLTGPGRPEAAVIYANAAHLAQTRGDRDTAISYAKQALSGLEGWAADDLPSLRLARQVLDAYHS